MNNNLKDQAIKDKTKALKPGFCCIGIVDSCMLKCKMCQKWQEDLGTKGFSQPTTEQWKTFIRQLRDLVDEGFEIDFGGGEALMRKDLLELVSYAKGLGFKNAIASNGFLIDEEMAKRIVDSGLDSIVLSLDSLKNEVHDRMRGVEGVAQRVHNAIKYLRKYSKDIHIGICSIIMEQTLDGILDLAEWVNINRDKTNSILFMAPMQPNNTALDADWYKEDFSFFWPKDIGKTSAILDELISRRKQGHWIGDSVVQLEAFKAYFANPDKFVKKSPCNLDRAIHASSIGDIFLCYRWALLGNIKEGADIREIWHSEAAQNARADIRKCQDNCHFLLNCFFEGDYPFALGTGVVQAAENKTE
ncbi:MAG: radical SAM protein [Candidatus Omnitrophica bacterium]|nr:radical SAM protein [Candidatus Omnitrophota bacterium]MDD5552710.1 radical SAM protein [Candidatus Omnitrophota bacterium]